MFATLGPLIFEQRLAPTSWQQAKAATFAQLGRVGQRPIVQHVGQAADTISLAMHFHADFCKPDEELALLYRLLEAAQPLQYTTGRGEDVGAFVLESVSATLRQAFPDGAAISIDVAVELLQSHEQAARTVLATVLPDDEPAPPIAQTATPLAAVAAQRVRSEAEAMQADVLAAQAEPDNEAQRIAQAKARNAGLPAILSDVPSSTEKTAVANAVTAVENAVGLAALAAAVQTLRTASRGLCGVVG